jgi:predicted metal-binding membrane protein
MTVDTAVERLVRRDHAVTATAVAGVAALAWLYLLRLSGTTTSDMSAMGMVEQQPWTLLDGALAATMWAVMMVAMMLPAATPMILMFATLNRKRPAGAATPPVNISLFILGYLLTWAGFSLAAAGGQWGLRAMALYSDEAMTVAPVVGGTLLIASGLYQLTPLKYACLARCRTPLGFLMSEWRDGAKGALVMGVRHGIYCVGCCWVLMALLFVGGVMNLAWVAAIAAFVFLEKVLPGGKLLSWCTGALLAAWGVWVVSRAV